MTKEECIALLIRYAEYDGIGIPNLAGCKEAMRTAAKLLSQPSLPSNLDEAATKYAKGEYDKKNPATLPDRCKGCYAPLMYAFKAGAEWMVGQGITVTGDTDDDYVRILKDIEEAICKIAPDSTVSVQVRK